MSDFSLGVAELGTQVNLAGLQQGLSEAHSMTQSQMAETASGSLSMFQTIFAVGLGNIVTQGLNSLVGAVKGIFGEMIADSEQAGQTQAQLGAVLQSTGGIAGMTKDSVNALAESISNVTPVSANAVTAGENMLLTFTNIGKGVFPQTTQAMVDMATAMNGGATPSAEQLSKTAIMLGKAINDPITGATALRRVGVSLTEQQTEQIKAFEKSGDTMAAQKIILNELATEFGGSATAASHTFTGSLEMLKNAFMSSSESASGTLQPALTNLGATLSSPAVVSAVRSLGEALTGILAGAINFVAGLIPTLISVWQTISPAFSDVIAAVQSAASDLASIAQEAFDWGANIGEQFASGIESAIGAVEDAINSIGSAAADLMAPGSPPKFMPHIDVWGRETAQVYLDAGEPPTSPRSKRCRTASRASSTNWFRVGRSTTKR